MVVSVIDVHALSNFTGYVKDEDNNPLSGASIVITDSYFNIIGYTSTNSAGYYSLSVTLSGNSPYILSQDVNTMIPI